MKTIYQFSVIIAVGLLIIFLLSRLGCLGGKNDVPAENVIPPDTVSWKNKAGDNVTSLKGTEDAFAQIRKHVADSVAKIYKVKLKNMEEYLIAWTESQSDIPADTTTRETDYIPSPVKDCPPVVKNMRQRFSNPYDTIDVQLGDSQYLRKRSYDTVTVVWSKGKEGKLFNKKRFLMASISFADTSRRVTKLDAYRVPAEKPKRWGIGAQAGGTYIMNKWRPYFGAGVSYNFIRF